MWRYIVLVIGLLGVVCACEESTEPVTHSKIAPASGSAQQFASEDVDCPVYDSRKWQAWINDMPTPSALARLHVLGEIDLPSAGYTGSLRLGEADIGATSGLHFSLHLKAPLKPMSQAITPTEVRYDGVAHKSSYRKITISCGSVVLAVIDNVETVQ